MIRSYLKIALRNLLRYKWYSLLSISGLAIGLACGILVALYAQLELSFDQYHAKKDRLYRLAMYVRNSGYPGGGIAKINGPWGPAAKEMFPEIEEVVRFVHYGPVLVASGESRFTETGGLYADQPVFSVFTWNLLSGDPATALKEPNTIVLTKELAEKYFGSSDPLGRTLTLDNTHVVKVTGVMENLPLNSHFTFTFLVSMPSLTNPAKESWTQWNQFYTYLLLRDRAQTGVIEEKLPAMLKTHMGAIADPYKPFLQPITDIHLHSNLFREMQPNSNVSTFVIMIANGLFLVLIGCINFVNLSTARASKRSKEVGVRKVTGADRMMLTQQFIGESLLVTVIAVCIAMMLAELAIPFFNAMADRSMSFGSANWRFYVSVALLTAIVGIGAGSYPAFLLSGFRPVDVLRGHRSGSSGAKLRKILVVLQFAFSAFFLIATGIVYDQLEFIRNKNPGFNQEQLVTIRFGNGALSASLETIKAELLKDPNVMDVSASSGQPSAGDFGIPVEIEGVPANQVPPIRILGVDQDFIRTFQMEIVQGRSFAKEFATDSSSYIINEEAARELGWSDATLHRVAMPAIGRPLSRIIGVVKDFHFRSLHEQIGPILLLIPPREWFALITVRLKPGHIDEALTTLERKWSQFDPHQPFIYTFFDDQFASLHAADRRDGQVLAFFSGLAIVIACLGLFGLAAFSAEQRTKEIGVRKVLGASVTRIAGMLSKESLTLVVVANVLAWPIAYLVMSRWLQGFAYRVELRWWTFFLSGNLVLIIAVLTVIWQAWRAAMANPVEALRYE